ncbi:ArsR/SmtB family transcription factor [Chitinophaga nivalis]|uniref:Metalloregulator ArsR/SmtB family transcription factor n=1 Tax=Chitinophaga nivalis TaxID=2991709 RepID=A0ABT3IJL4_9BACT|nr:metalloregulator ArsR/SmtB family transcription factor [Chitinophaga nivalis]MCW3466153.1 metalloregulator ArsR/SmtB family transcription factor [Chitinophaga nivalis]MCW3484156.1 metalloregulator ArsR/SmtB family transcription factor [Chitinophaga nivalis]
MDNKKFERISRALSDPSRISILQEIRKKQGCMYCAEITEMLALTQPSVSHHLKQLVDADLLIPEKEGRNLKYVINQKELDDYIQFLNNLKA